MAQDLLVARFALRSVEEVFHLQEYPVLDLNLVRGQKFALELAGNFKYTHNMVLHHGCNLLETTIL